MIVSGEPAKEDNGKLSERGKNQIMELAYSRLVAGISKIYTSTKNSDQESAKILSKEFQVRVDKKGCLDAFNPGVSWDDFTNLSEALSAIWNDETYTHEKGESLADARERFGICMNDLGSRHPDDSFAVVTDTTMAFLFYSLVTAAPLSMEEWLKTGFASCATYEYTKTGWKLVMQPDNSFLTDPSMVSDWLPEDLFA
jgi:broad specificity phosphatase PhoE